jgi:hypothetical protein
LARLLLRDPNGKPYEGPVVSDGSFQLVAPEGEIWTGRILSDFRIKLETPDHEALRGTYTLQGEVFVVDGRGRYLVGQIIKDDAQSQEFWEPS